MRNADGRNFFYQWEKNRTVIVPENCKQVHFDNGTTEKALTCKVKEVNGQRVAEVPNIFLQTAGKIEAYAWDGERVLVATALRVLPRPKPEGYVYEQTDVVDVETAVLEVMEALKAAGLLPKGDPGEPGDPGKTPVKGVDYLTPEDIEAYSGVFIAEYGVTSITELNEAYNAGKMLFCKDGAYISPLYQKSSAGSFSFYSNDSANQTNRYCTQKNVWNKKIVALCSGTLADLQEELSQLREELETVKQELKAIKEGGGGSGTTMTFYVDGEAYRAERGMTWEQFIASQDNPDKYFDCCDYVGKMFDIYKGDIEYEDYVFISGCCGPPSFVDTGEMPAFGWDEIIEGHHYSTWQ